jgi:hypothetical protein
MRVPFELQNFQPFSFSVEGTTYTYPNVRRLAEKLNLVSNISESVVETPDGKKVWLTLVGAEDQAPPNGIQRGWYVAQVLDDASAAVLVKAFAAIAGER